MHALFVAIAELNSKVHTSFIFRIKKKKKKFKWDKTLIKEFERAFSGDCNRTKESPMPYKTLLPIKVMLTFSCCGIHENEKRKM